MLHYPPSCSRQLVSQTLASPSNRCPIFVFWFILGGSPPLISRLDAVELTTILDGSLEEREIVLVRCWVARLGRDSGLEREGSGMMALDDTGLMGRDETEGGPWPDMYRVMYFIGRQMPVMMGKYETCVYSLQDVLQLSV